MTITNKCDAGPRRQDVHSIDTERGYQVALSAQGWVFGVASDEPILLGAEQAGVELPYSCRNGTCRTCLCQMKQGSVCYRVEWPGVSAEEKADGWILPCVAYATADLVLDVPAALRV